MMIKILLALANVLTISALGSALTCNLCAYTSNWPKKQQVCTKVECPAGKCYKLTYTSPQGHKVISSNCDTIGFCPDVKDECADITKQLKLTGDSCKSTCCTTDNCNNDKDFATGGKEGGGKKEGKSGKGGKGDNSAATGIMATKFTLCVMIIAGFLVA